MRFLQGRWGVVVEWIPANLLAVYWVGNKTGQLTFAAGLQPEDLKSVPIWRRVPRPRVCLASALCRVAAAGSFCSRFLYI